MMKSTNKPNRFQSILKKIVIAAILLGLLGGIVLTRINLRMYFTTRNSVRTAEALAEFAPDCILVLGAGVRDDGTPSHMLEDRLKTGISLHQAGISDTLLMSGDHGRAHYDEVNTMKNYAKAAGIPSEDIFMDHAGFSTYDSLYRAKAVFGAERVVIVSQGYHLYRALYIARSLGLEAAGVSADLRPYAGQFMREIREILARGKDFLYTVTKPSPTYLGAPIDLSGSGDATNDQ